MVKSLVDEHRKSSRRRSDGKRSPGRSKILLQPPVQKKWDQNLLRLTDDQSSILYCTAASCCCPAQAACRKLCSLLSCLNQTKTALPAVSATKWASPGLLALQVGAEGITWAGWSLWARPQCAEDSDADWNSVTKQAKERSKDLPSSFIMSVESSVAGTSIVSQRWCHSSSLTWGQGTSLGLGHVWIHGRKISMFSCTDTEAWSWKTSWMFTAWHRELAIGESHNMSRSVAPLQVGAMAWCHLWWANSCAELYP